MKINTASLVRKIFAGIFLVLLFFIFSSALPKKTLASSAYSFINITSGLSGLNLPGSADDWVAIRVYLKNSVTGADISGSFTVTCKYDSFSNGIYYEGPDSVHTISRYSVNCSSGSAESGSAVGMGGCVMPFWLSAKAPGFYDSDLWLVNHEVGFENTLYNEGNRNTANYYVYLDPLPPPPVSTGTVQGLKILPDGTWVPENWASVSLDSGPNIRWTNPYYFFDVPAGRHMAWVSIPEGYDVGWTVCTGPADTWSQCHAQTPNPGSIAEFDVPAGWIADLWWHYKPKPIKLRGQVINSPTGEGIPNVVINQGVTDPPGCRIGTATTNAQGYFEYTVDYGASFCLRAPTLADYEGPSPLSYECQTAGYLKRPDDCGLSLDKSSDLSYNFYYTKRSHILGRVFFDDNGNGKWDTNEKFLRDPDSTVPDSNCTNYEEIDGSGIVITGPETHVRFLTECNTQPYYDSGVITIGDYNVRFAPPSGWKITSWSYPQDWAKQSDGSVSGKLLLGRDAHIWWGIRKLPTCSLKADPQVLPGPGESFISLEVFGMEEGSRVWITTEGGASPGMEISQTLVENKLYFVVTVSQTTTYIATVENSVGQNSCIVKIDIGTASPSPISFPESPSPSFSPFPSPSPSIEIITTKPNSCQDAVETEKLTDNYITNNEGDSPLNPIEVSATGPLGQSVALTGQFTYSIDFSKLQALFGFNNSDYLEGRFQDDSHADWAIADLKSAELNKYYGPVNKTTPKTIVDAERVKYVKYIAQKTSIVEAGIKYTDIYGKNPLTISQLISQYGYPKPPSAGSTSSIWLNGWGKYWSKIPVAYSEIYKGKLEFRVSAGEENFRKLQEGEGCATDLARSVEFIVPDFGRTTLISDLLNQTIVPKEAQSFRDHRIASQGIGKANEETVLGEKKDGILNKVIEICKKAIISYPKKFIKQLGKTVVTSFNLLKPVKTVYAQETAQNEELDTTCVKVTMPGKISVAPYCALPPNQLQSGDSCTNVISENKLDKDNPNVICTFNVSFSIQKVINPQDPTWDSCTDNGDGTYTCKTKLRIFPDFRIPWLAEIWNNTAYSDESEGTINVRGDKDGTGEDVLGTDVTIGGVRSPQVTGRPGIYKFFIPKIVSDRLNAPAANLPTASEVTELRKKCSLSNDYSSESCQKIAKLIDDLIKLYPDWSGTRQAEECVQVNEIKPGSQITRCLEYFWGFFGSNAISAQTPTDMNADISDIRVRVIGSADCAKFGARDLSLKPQALKRVLGIGQSCPLGAELVSQTIEPPPGGGGEPPPPGNCAQASDGNPANGIETSREEIQCYVTELAAGEKEPITGDNLANVMLRMMQLESGGGNQCAVAADDEIGVFQYIAATWKSSAGNNGMDSGSGTQDQYRGGRTVCWGIPGGDPNRHPGDSLRSWTLNFGVNLDGEAWNPYKQVQVAKNDLLAARACAWTSFRVLYPGVCP